MAAALSDLRRNRKLILLFTVMVLVPGILFGALIARAVRTDSLDLARQRTEQRQQVARLLAADLNQWIFSTGAASASVHAAVRFEQAGDRVRFPDLGLSLPIDASARPVPLDRTEAGGSPLPKALVDAYFPRIVVFL